MRINRYVLCALFALVIAPASHAVGLPDSGQTLCDDGANNMVACSSVNSGDAATMPRQDGRFGRDAAAAGVALDYTRVCNSGELAGSGSCPTNPVLGSTANEWGCTQDNITGLMWEVKVNDNTHLRHNLWTYTWYDSIAATNGGNVGTESGGTCIDGASGTNCDTEKYVVAVNAAALCSYGDWRLPSKRELRSIVHLGQISPTLNTTYFPTTYTWMYWTASTLASTPTSGWQVNFTNGADLTGSKSTANPIQLVRGATF